MNKIMLDDSIATVFVVRINERIKYKTSNQETSGWCEVFQGLTFCASITEICWQ